MKTARPYLNFSASLFAAITFLASFAQATSGLRCPDVLEGRSTPQLLAPAPGQNIQGQTQPRPTSSRRSSPEAPVAHTEQNRTYTPPAARPGVSPDLVRELQGQRISRVQEQLNSEIQRRGLGAVLYERATVPGHDTHFTNSVRTPAPRFNQQDAGICHWSATLSLNESIAANREVVPPGTQFSRAYAHFYFLFEHANMHLEQLEAFRHNSSNVLSHTVRSQVAPHIQDGAYPEEDQYIIDKYGILPENEMPSTVANLTDTAALLARMNDYLEMKSKEYWNLAQTLGHGPTADGIFLQEHQGFRSTHTTVEVAHLTPEQLGQLAAKRREIMSGVWKMLRSTLGTPPPLDRTFEVRLLSPETPEHNTVDSRSIIDHLTPLQYRDRIGYKPMIEVVNFPTRPHGEHLTVQYADTLAPRRMINLGWTRQFQMIVQSIDDNVGTSFSAIIDRASNYHSGVLHPAITRNWNVYGMTSQEAPQPLNTVGLSYLARTAADHQMWMNQYDRPQYAASAAPRRPRTGPLSLRTLAANQGTTAGIDVLTVRKAGIQQSWGTDVGDGGDMFMYPPWGEQNIESIMAPESYLTHSEKQIWNSNPIHLTIQEDVR